MAKKDKTIELEFKAKTKEFDEAVQRSNEELKTQRKELKLNATELKGDSDNVELLSKRQSILSREEESCQNKINALNNKLVAAKEKFGDNSTEVKNLNNQILDAKNQYAGIQNEIKNTNTKLTELNESTKKVNEEEEKYTTTTRKFNESISKSEKELEILGKELKLNATELKGDSDNVELLSKRQSILSKEEESCQSKINALNNKLVEAKKQFGDNSTEVENLNNQILDAKTQYAGIQNEINRTDTKLKSLQNTTDGTANEFDDLADSVEKSGKEAEQSAKGGWSVAKQMLADFASSALESIKEKFKEIAIEGEQALDLLRAKTNGTFEDVKKNQDVAKRVYKNAFGDSLSDVTDALGTVIEMTGDLDDVTLQNVTENAMTLSDVYDMDIKESMRAVKSMVDQFGISYEEAFDIIVAGTQNGLNQNDDFLDTLNEYSVQYKNAGYSAQDMFNMLKNGAETGTWSIDKLGDALKEYNIRMSDGTANDYLKDLGLNAEKLTSQYAKGGESAKQATQEIINALKNTEDKQKQYIAGQGIMGTMWEDLGADAVFSLVDTQGEIDATSDSMSQLADDAYDNLGTAFQGIGATFEMDLLQPLADDTSSLVWNLIPAIQGLISGLAEGYNWCKENKGILTGLAVVIGIITTAVIAYNAVQGITAAIQSAKTAANLAETASLWSLVAAQSAAIAPYILIVAAIAAVIAVIVIVVKHFDKIKQVVGDVFNSAKEKVLDFKDKIVDTFKNLGTNIVDGFRAIPDKIRELFDKLRDKIKTPKIEVTYSTDGTLGKVATALGLEGFPKLKINWNKYGGVFEHTTVLAQGFAEAGDPEMAMPLNDKNTAPFAANIAGHMPTNDYTSMLDRIYQEIAAGNASILDKIVEAVSNRIVWKLNGRELARAQAKG
ncbi:MAG: phage tail tape measure protein [Clostridium sp.]|nr:phage tail tape measure protein [Clostridium sp.]